MAKTKKASSSLISQQLVSFKGGVSQQPIITRYPDQVAEQINGFSSESAGLHKRPPSIHIARLSDHIDHRACKFHVINRDETEQYLLKLTNGDLEVWDLMGNKKEVKFPQGRDYLNVENPEDNFRCVTVADYTFVLNNTVKTEMTDLVTPSTNENTVLMEVRGANYGKVFSIFIENEFVAGLAVPNGGAPWNVTYVNTSRIAENLLKSLKGVPTVNPDEGAIVTTYEDLTSTARSGYGNALLIGWNPSWSKRNEYKFSIVGDSTLVVQRKDKKVFKFKLEDGFGGQNFLSCAGEVKGVNKLLSAAPDGYTTKILGEAGSTDDDYYVKWDDTKKVWKESLGEGLKYKISFKTMPHAIVREADGTFSFKELEWANREVGDDETNPEPSFIGNTINDIFFYRNRLGFISEESIILSETSDFFNFWYNSAVTIQDTDPIDVAVSSNKVAILKHAVPFARELMLFSKEGQFVLGSDGVMTPKSVKVDQVTAFTYSDDCTPVNIGSSIYFINNRVKHCSLMRYYTVQDFAELKDAEDTSAHVPTYIPVGIRKLSGNTTYDTILCLSDTHPEYVWVYKYLYSQGQAVQQSWSKWFLGDGVEVVLAEYVDAYIYLLVNTKSGLYLDRMLLTGLASDFANEPYRYMMDAKVEYTVPQESSYDDYVGATQFDFKKIYGAIPSLEKNYYYVADTEGYIHKITNEDVASDGTFYVKGDFRGKIVYIGRGYKFHVVLSPLSIKIPMGNTMISEDEGRLQVRYFWFNYENSGPMKSTVFDVSMRRSFKYISTNKYLDKSNFRLGRNMIIGDKFKFPVQRRSKGTLISFESELPTPLNIISGGWEGYYVRRNRKV